MKKSFKGRLAMVALAPLLAAWCVSASASEGTDGATAALAAKATKPGRCEKIVLTGAVSAGHEWKEAFGEGWVFRVLPIPDGKTAPGVGGWDLVVDRDRPAGYPDALMLATPPYHLINEREIATTYGLRAQDVIGWNPRKFRFMTNRSSFREAHRLFLQLDRDGVFNPAPQSSKDGRKEKSILRKKERFLKLTADSSQGEFHILDAHLTPGVGKVKPYALNWARLSENTPHTDEPPPGGNATPLGQLEWVRFSVALWLPPGWKLPRDIRPEQVSCPDRN
jgi:hypothetical protein